tara:strand:+ start:209 stop:550 length:342 start_codon:yes stop_codon:yes gene_type:complete
MKLLRRHLRQMIIREAKKALSNDVVFENLLLNLLDSEDIEGEISVVKRANDTSILDDLIQLPEFERRLENLDDEKVIKLLGKIRSSVSASTFERIKSTVISHKPSTRDSLESM